MFLCLVLSDYLQPNKSWTKCNSGVTDLRDSHAFLSFYPLHDHSFYMLSFVCVDYYNPYSVRVLVTCGNGAKKKKTNRVKLLALVEITVKFKQEEDWSSKWSENSGGISQFKEN